MLDSCNFSPERINSGKKILERSILFWILTIFLRNVLPILAILFWDVPNVFCHLVRHFRNGTISIRYFTRMLWNIFVKFWIRPGQTWNVTVSISIFIRNIPVLFTWLRLRHMAMRLGILELAESFSTGTQHHENPTIILWHLYMEINLIYLLIMKVGMNQGFGDLTDQPIANLWQIGSQLTECCFYVTMNSPNYFGYVRIDKVTSLNFPIAYTAATQQFYEYLDWPGYADLPFMSSI